MKSWEFQCPKCAFIDIIKEYEALNPKFLKMQDKEREAFVDRFLKKHFQDYNPNHE